MPEWAGGASQPPPPPLPAGRPHQIAGRATWGIVTRALQAGAAPPRGAVPGRRRVTRLAGGQCTCRTATGRRVLRPAGQEGGRARQGGGGCRRDGRRRLALAVDVTRWGTTNRHACAAPDVGRGGGHQRRSPATTPSPQAFLPPSLTPVSLSPTCLVRVTHTKTVDSLAGPHPPADHTRAPTRSTTPRPAAITPAGGPPLLAPCPPRTPPRCRRHPRRRRPRGGPPWPARPPPPPRRPDQQHAAGGGCRALPVACAQATWLLSCWR